MSLNTACSASPGGKDATPCEAPCATCWPTTATAFWTSTPGAAVWAARFRAQARGLGRTLDLGDALIAGTARSHELTIATRNVRDFAGLDVNVVNPWDTR